MHSCCVHRVGGCQLLAFCQPDDDKLCSFAPAFFWGSQRRGATLFYKHGHVVFAKAGAFIPVWEEGAERQGREGNTWGGGRGQVQG